MIKKMFSKRISILVITLAGLVCITPLSYAIPSLQLYIPGSTYDSTTESWTTYDSNFELQVLGASSPNNADYITNLKLYIAILATEYGMSGAYININGVPINLNIYGTPPPIPPHSIFPTYYGEYSLPNLMVSTAGKTVYNYNPGETGSDLGDIHSLQIDWSDYTFVHFDAAGTVVGNNGHTWQRRAPFSHDAEAVVPEPSTMFLLLPGFLGLAGFRRRNQA